MWAALGGLGLAACGGGGGGGGDSGYFAIEGTRSAGAVPVTICIDDAAYTDPASTDGKRVAATLASYYGIVGGYRSFGGEGQSCRERFATLDDVVSVDEYNEVIVPAVAAGTPSPAPARMFFTWTGSGNDHVVLDASNEQFKFYSDNGCLYSVNRDMEFTNFCLVPGTPNVRFEGTTYTVMSIRSTAGGCIVGLADVAGRQVDVYTGDGGQEFVEVLSVEWDRQGCTR